MTEHDDVLEPADPAATACTGGPVWPVVVGALIGATAALFWIWLDAVPRDVACAATEVSFPSCGTAADRERAGAVWTVVLGILLVVTLAFARTRPVLARVCLVVLVVVAFVGYGAVMGSTGYVVSAEGFLG